VRQCTHCGSRVDDVATHCPNCGEPVPPAAPASYAKAQNGWLGAGIGCGSYIALAFVLWLSTALPIPDQARSAAYIPILAAFLIALIWVAIANRRPGFLIGYLIVLLVPLGLFGACVGFFAVNGFNTR